MQYGVNLTSVTGTPILVVRRRATLPELSKVVSAKASISLCAIAHASLRCRITIPSMHLPWVVSSVTPASQSNSFANCLRSTVLPDPAFERAPQNRRAVQFSRWTSSSQDE